MADTGRLPADVMAALGAAARAYAVTTDDILGESRRDALVLARNAVISALRSCGYSRAELASFLSRDVTSIRYAQLTMDELLEAKTKPSARGARLLAARSAALAAAVAARPACSDDVMFSEYAVLPVVRGPWLAPERAWLDSQGTPAFGGWIVALKPLAQTGVPSPARIAALALRHAAQYDYAWFHAE